MTREFEVFFESFNNSLDNWASYHKKVEHEIISECLDEVARCLREAKLEVERLEAASGNQS